MALAGVDHANIGHQLGILSGIPEARQYGFLGDPAEADNGIPDFEFFGVFWGTIRFPSARTSFESAIGFTVSPERSRLSGRIPG